ncbi:Non-hem dioxygenase N-terminal domain [Arabidopsis thaliana x Arabidopsis arenosa]|uniref:Non-hem dioxygenase N-terminal domain n=1 Tax=Arabidopsis thaliana x Arabidopsis arenosa TaxID=1240361 RepID=A0A8T1XM88_9BRAS|nr:Non-hem dioxygenase N-terminal domain [Arabidopsis thaliana x Arabidopsis arenosa]
MEIERDQHISPPSLLAQTIPIIDLSNLDEELVARLVVQASEEWGIFHVVNHGIPLDLIRRLKEVGTQFFELPETEKKSVAKQDGSKDFEGYTTNLKYVEGEVWTENLFHRIWPPSCINFNYWPKNPPHYREVIEEYTEDTKKLSERILGYLSEGLGLPREALIQGLGGESTEYVMRINNYPPDTKPDLTLGVPEHTDIIGITIIITNEVPGLQIFKDDRWFDVHYIPSAITVNIGDQIMRLSNGKYKNVLHRAIVDKEKQRMSWPVFVDANPDVVIGPLPELITCSNPSKFKPITCKDFKYRRLLKLPIE